MKKQILIIGAVCLFNFSQAQEVFQNQVPSIVLNQFNTQFPNASDVEWEMERELYNVDFELGWNIDHEVWYSAEGKMVKHEEDISSTELPAAVKNKIKTDFSGYSIDDLERITDRGIVVYKMELNSLMQQDYDIVFDENGKIISQIND